MEAKSSEEATPSVAALIYGNVAERYAASFDKLREPFPKNRIGLLPKTTKRPELEYVGHGAITERLLDVDPQWTWEPMGYAPDGSPAVDRNDRGDPIGLWIKLTVLGVTRPGYGDCEAGQFSAMKVLVGDALRNAAMRFGIALDLWVRGQSEDAERFRGDTHGDRPLAPAPPVLSPEEQAVEDHVQAVVQQAKDLKKLDNEGTGPYWKAVVEAAGELEDAKPGSAKAILAWIRSDEGVAEETITNLVRDLKAERDRVSGDQAAANAVAGAARVSDTPPPAPRTRKKPGSAVTPEVEAAVDRVTEAFPGATEE